MFLSLLGGRGHTLTRYFESGCYSGSMAAFNPLIPADRVDPVPYRVFTTSDVLKRKTDGIAKREKRR